MMTTRFARLKYWALAAACALLTADATLTLLHPKVVHAQGYSGALPNILTPASGLVVTYTNGTVTSGGLQTAITGNTVTVSNTQTDCSAPGYASCNFIYWNTGASLSTTTTAATAFAPGNVVIAYVTATGGNVSVVTPAAWSPSSTGVNNQPGNSTNTAGAYWVPPGNCWYSVATGTLTTPTFGAAAGVTALGLNNTTATAPAVPVMQVATTNASVISVNTINCLINPPSTVGITGRGINLVNADFFYGIQQSGGVNATQLYTLASGTMNGALVFSKVVMPTPGASETPSTVAPVRADTGTLAVTPSGATFNSLVTTAGAFFTQRYTPSAPFSLSGDDTLYYISMTFLCNTTQATTINTPGVMIHFTS